jgi:hypothetical protein
MPLDKLRTKQAAIAAAWIEAGVKVFPPCGRASEGSVKSEKESHSAQLVAETTSGIE